MKNFKATEKTNFHFSFLKYSSNYLLESFKQVHLDSLRIIYNKSNTCSTKPSNLVFLENFFVLYSGL